jgi:hypothetical protein
LNSSPSAKAEAEVKRLAKENAKLQAATGTAGTTDSGTTETVTIPASNVVQMPSTKPAKVAGAKPAQAAIFNRHICVLARGR